MIQRHSADIFVQQDGGLKPRLPVRLDVHAKHVMRDLRTNPAEAGADLLSAIKGHLYIRQDILSPQFIHKVFSCQQLRRLVPCAA